ncbi:MAG: hypothetical protein HOO97_04815 [Sideroxydans sp.]|nr:hypothetical protein [Sideroxydans sp.]
MKTFALTQKMRGFSLVEIMVGMIIGMIGIIVIMQVTSVFEGQKRTTTGGDDAQNNGAIALHGISLDVKQAGYGFSNPALLGDGLVTPNVTLNNLAPVTIINNGSCNKCAFNVDADTDAFMVVYGNSNTTADGALITSTTGGNYNITRGATPAVAVAGAGGAAFVESDYVTPDNGATGVAATNPHYLYQVNAPNAGAVPINDLAYGIPHPTLVNDKATGGNHPILFNFGRAPAILVYAVNGGTLWVCNFMQQDCAATPATPTWTPLAEGIVSMRAECTTAAPAYAMRLVLVSRSVQSDLAVTSNVPTWGGLNAINLTGTNVPVGFGWQNFRYKTFETVIPLRNVAWSGKGVAGCL